MPFIKGSRHSEEARRKMSAARRGIPHSEDRKAKMAAANRGKVRARTFRAICRCGTEFVAGSSNAKFCSSKCKRAAKGHGLRHAPEFKAFPQKCAVCGATDDLVGDHDHETGRARGILCRNCNLAIGNMRDNPERLRAAAAYLEHAAARPTVYISGPMSGLKDSNYPAFHAEALRIRRLGYHVENPATNPAPPCGSWEAYMRMALRQMLLCDTVALLPGWENSRGANREVAVASELGLRVVTAAELVQPVLRDVAVEAVPC